MSNTIEQTTIADCIDGLLDYRAKDYIPLHVSQLAYHASEKLANKVPLTDKEEKIILHYAGIYIG